MRNRDTIEQQHRAELERLAADRAAALNQTFTAHEQLRLHQQFLRSVLDTDPNFVFVKNPEGRFVLVNKALADAYHTTVEEMVGKSDADYNLDAEQVAAYLEADRRMIASGQQVFITEEIFAASKGRTQWVQTVKRPIRVPGSDAIHVLGIATDITARKEAMAALQRSEARLEEAQRIAHLGSWEYDLVTQKIRWSREMFRQFGVALEQEEPDYAKTLSFYHPEDAARLVACCERAIAERSGYALDMRILSSKGEAPRWYRAVGRTVVDADGKVTGLVGTQSEITERRQAEEQLQASNERLIEGTALLQQKIERINEQTALLELQKSELERMNARLELLATTDGLTGLKNHRTFQERLKDEVNRANRAVSPVSVLLLDVDEFKIFNDTFGHPAGDIVLQKVAEALEAIARKSDLVARYGGEEFAVILPDTDAQGAKSIAETLRRAIETVPWTVKPVTASFGAATWTSTESDAAGLIKQADSALYRSKLNGRNCVTHSSDAEVSVSVSEDKLKPYAQMVRQALDLHEDTLAGASGEISDHLLQIYEATVASWLKVLKMRDLETAGHCERTAALMTRLAQRAGMHSEEILYVKWGALLHDIGKLGIPDQVLHKLEPLTDEELTLVRSHPTLACEMLSPIPFLSPALDIPCAHHENWDGTGYPQGLRGDDIPLVARLFAVIDVYDALRHSRPYRNAWPEAKVLNYLRQQAGTQFDPRAVSIFLEMLEEEKAASYPVPRAA